MSERFADPPGDAWMELSPDDHHHYWATFEKKFGFQAGVSANSWPAISEPTPSRTFDLSVIADGPPRGAAYDAINAEALRAFVWGLPETELIVLDWQHPGYRQVKGVSGSKPIVLLTANEISAAENQVAWHLAVVTSALSSPAVVEYTADATTKAARPYVYKVRLDDPRVKPLT